VQTKLFVSRLINRGHDVAVCTLHGLQAAPITWNGIKCFPATSSVGTEAIGRYSENWGAEVTISLFDAWAIDPELFRNSEMRWVPWFPVDMEPLPKLVKDSVERAFASIVFSRFGERMCQQAGLTPFYVPHAVDTRVYRPIPRHEARDLLGCPRDKFVVGMVAANKDYPSRKAFPQVMEAFARFAERHSDALLYLHTRCGDEPFSVGTINIHALAQQLGIQNRLIVADALNLALGFDEAHMANVYSALDCLASPSLGEGFGVPILEAQACGCPVIVGDWTSMGELCFAGSKVPLERSEPFWTQLNSFFRLAHVNAIDDCLEELYELREDTVLRGRATAGAQAYDADRVLEQYWLPVLDDLDKRIRQGQSINKKAALLLRMMASVPVGPVAEVGCLRRVREVRSDGWSTAYLARACADRNVAFMSYDRDAMVVDMANRVLRERQLGQCVTCCDGAEALRAAEPLALLYLDGSDDPADTVMQFRAAALLPGGVLVVDDAQSSGASVFGKATRLVPLLSERGQVFEIVLTESGFAALVARFSDGKQHESW